MVTKVYLVRHAEADGNVNETFQGRTDTAVTQKGHAQLAELAERFRDIPITALYVSPLLRTRQTAEAVNRYHGLTPHYREDLMEIDGGAWEGKPWSEIPTLFAQAYDLWQNRMYDFHAPQGEAMQAVYDRMRRAIGEIAAAHPGQTIAVVSHGCAIRNYLAFASGEGITGLCNVGWSDNTSLSLVEFDEAGNVTLVFKNDASHLSPELSTLAHSKWCRYENEEFLTDSGFRPDQEKREAAQ